MASSASTVLDDFRRYATLIEATLAKSHLGFMPESETASSIQVERAIAYPAVVLDPKRPTPSIDLLLDASVRPDVGHLASFEVVDRTGHRRAHYRGLLFYSAFQTFQTAYETLPTGEFGKWEEGLRPWADMLEAQLTQINLSPARDAAAGEPPGVTGETGTSWIAASRGAMAADAAWMALALHVAGKIYIRDAWTDLASDLFGRVARAQQASGAFLTATAGDNPEAHWYHELVLLHAAGSYAVMTENRPLAGAVARNAEYHLNQTQPDHATNQPWGLFPLIWNPSSRALAEGMLHSGEALSGATAGGLSALTSILLADALYCLRLFLR